MSMGLPRKGREHGTQNGWFSDEPISEWIVIIHSFEFVSVCWIYWNLRHWLSELKIDMLIRIITKGTFCNRACPSQWNIIWDWLSRPPKYAQVIRGHHHKMRLNIKLVWSTNRQFWYARKIYLAGNTCCTRKSTIQANHYYDITYLVLFGWYPVISKLGDQRYIMLHYISIITCLTSYHDICIYIYI